MSEETRRMDELLRENEALRRQVAALEAEARRFADRPHIEDALRESEAKHRAVVERANDGIVMANGKRIVFSNPAFARMTGYSLAELDGMEILQLVPAEHHGLIAERLKRRLAGQHVPNNYEIDLLRKDGALCSVEVNGGLLQYRDQPYDLVILRDITERKRVEEERLFLTTVFNNMMEGVYLVRAADGTIASANSRFEQMFGYEPGELIGQHVSIVNAPTERSPEETAAEITAELRRNRVWLGEVQNVRKDGTVFWSHAVVATYTHPRHGEVWVSIHRDITDRKQMEVELRRHRDRLDETVRERTADLGRTVAALHQSEERSRTTLYAIGDAVISTDIAGRVAQLNPVAEALTRWSEAEATGRSLGEVFHIIDEDTRSEIPSPVDRVLGEGTVVGLANGTLLIARDGTEVPIADSAAPIRDEHGETTGVVLVFRDQTAERAARRAIQDSEQRLARETAGVAAIVREMLSGATQDTGTDRQVLTACLEATGSVHGAIGRLNANGTYDVTSHESRGATANEPLEATWRRLPVHDGPLTFNAPAEGASWIGSGSGSVPFTCFLAVPVREEGRSTGVVAVANKPGGYTDADLGTLVRLVDVMVVSRRHRDLLGELDRRVRDRTAQLLEANRELEAFSYSVSHDLRAPLRAMDGFTRILAERYGSALDSEGMRLCSVIRESTGRMSRLIDDLLAFSRLGRAEMHMLDIDMAAVVRSVFHELTATETARRIDFQVGPLPGAVGDPSLMHQVWANLLGNAVKFTSKRERAAIQVTGEQRGGEVVFAVRDNGAGFDMRYAGQLFGVFKRLHSPSDFEGNGVGLALVERVIRRHGGRVWAEGQPDRGATFFFALPESPTARRGA